MDAQASPFLSTPSGFASSDPGYTSALAQGQNNFQNGLRNFGGGMQELAEGIKQHRQNVQDAASADTTFHMLLPQMQKSGVPIDPEVLNKFASSSLSQKKGMIGAMSMQYATALKSQQDQAQMNELNARANYYNSGVQEKADEAQGLTRFAQNLDEQINSAPVDPLTGQPMTNNPDTAALLNKFTPEHRAIIHAAATMGPTNPRLAASLVKPLFDQFSGQDNKPQSFDMGGHSGIYNPKTGNFSVFGTPQVQTLTDENGNDVQVLDNGRGKVVPLPASKGGITDKDQFTAITHQINAIEGNPAMSIMLESKAKLADLYQQKADLLKGSKVGKASKADAAAAQQMKPSPDDIKYLQSNPHLEAAFNKKFGDGAADQYLP